MILCGFLGLLKIFQDSFEIIKIFKDYVGFVDADVGFAISVMLVIGVDSRDAVGFDVDNIDNVEDIEITFKFSKDS